MPQYHDKENWNNRGSVTITSSGLRSLPIIRNLIPYHVGDKIKFHVHIEKPNTRNLELFSHFVYEKFSNNNIRKLPDPINGTDGDFEGNIINTSGDVEYSIGTELHYGFPDPIITFTVNSWDTVLNNWFQILIAAILGGVVSFFITIFSGIVTINESGYLLIPKWIIDYFK